MPAGSIAHRHGCINRMPASAAREQFGEVRCRERSSEQKTLNLFATFILQHGGLLLMFDAFGVDADPIEWLM